MAFRSSEYLQRNELVRYQLEHQVKNGLILGVKTYHLHE